MIRALIAQVYAALNKILPKYNQVLVIGSTKVESNAIETANYICANYDIPVYFALAEGYVNHVKKLLNPEIKLVSFSGISFRSVYLTSKYILSTNDIVIGPPVNGQMMVNIWHGIFYKNIRKLRNDPEIPATITVGTSPLTKKMFAEAFGVSPTSVFISGYPRNDMMLRAKSHAAELKGALTPDLSAYRKILIWMPTFRRSNDGSVLKEGLERDNPFQVPSFNDQEFNRLLNAQDALCLIKPHYFGLDNVEYKKYSNIMVIDDEWIARQGITLYELIACTDALITDFSSVIIDYLLLDKPVLCFCKDLQEYKQNQGLYFPDIENYIPTEITQDESQFFGSVQSVLRDETDIHQEKRRRLKDLFFTYDDMKSSERLMEHVFKSNVLKREKGLKARRL